MSLSTGRSLNRQKLVPLLLLQDVLNGVHQLARQNPSGIDVQDHDCRTFLDGTDEENYDDSTYNEKYGEVIETYDNDDGTSPRHNDAPVDTGVAATDLRNLRRNAGVHSENYENNEEDRRSTASEGEKIITPRENKNGN